MRRPRRLRDVGEDQVAPKDEEPVESVTLIRSMNDNGIEKGAIERVVKSGTWKSYRRAAVVNTQTPIVGPTLTIGHGIPSSSSSEPPRPTNTRSSSMRRGVWIYTVRTPAAQADESSCTTRRAGDGGIFIRSTGPRRTRMRSGPTTATPSTGCFGPSTRSKPLPNRPLIAPKLPRVDRLMALAP
jgi:hypothetical protein